MDKKKNFTSKMDEIIPAMNFISNSSIEQNTVTNNNTTSKKYLSSEEIEAINVPEGFRVNPILIEKKSKKMALAIYPSLHKKLKEMASKKNMSVNDYICKAISIALEEEKI
ncbi:toxin-antitoxin system HicB family antitoxin [Megamonas funiformis]|uniref:toxin-antitoxin system HicB family antitoxin n=1 Tax=Megamonas funiformis TaxID=437897 RepID=UPI003993F107